MKTLKFSGAFFLVAFLLGTMSARAKDYLYDFDYGLLLNAGMEKTLVSRLDLSLQAELWTNDNFAGYERIMPAASLTYTVIPKYFKAMAYYAFINQKNHTNRHRYQIGLVGSYAVPHLSLSLATKFEQTWTKGTPNNKWRTQLKAVGIISPSCRWKPFVSMEIFESMNGHNATGTTGLERVRYEAGTTFAAGKRVSLEMKWRSERLTQKKLLYSSIGLGVKFKL